MWVNRYELSADGRPLATWKGSAWRSGGMFELEGRHYEVRLGHKHWTVMAGGATFQFRRTSMWRQEGRSSPRTGR